MKRNVVAAVCNAIASNQFHFIDIFLHRQYFATYYLLWNTAFLPFLRSLLEKYL